MVKKKTRGTRTRTRQGRASDQPTFCGSTLGALSESVRSSSLDWRISRSCREQAAHPQSSTVHHNPFFQQGGANAHLTVPYSGNSIPSQALRRIDCLSISVALGEPIVSSSNLLLPTSGRQLEHICAIPFSWPASGVVQVTGPYCCHPETSKLFCNRPSNSLHYLLRHRQ